MNQSNPPDVHRVRPRMNTLTVLQSIQIKYLCIINKCSFFLVKGSVIHDVYHIIERNE